MSRPAILRSPIDIITFNPSKGASYLAYQSLIATLFSLGIMCLNFSYLFQFKTWLSFFSLIRLLGVPFHISHLFQIWSITSFAQSSPSHAIRSKLKILMESSHFSAIRSLNILSYFLVAYQSFRLFDWQGDYKEFCHSLMSIIIFLFRIGLAIYAFKCYKNSNQGLSPVQSEFFQKKHGDLMDSCVICRAKFQINQKIKVLPCCKSHIFHAECIDRWFQVKVSCPLCRNKIS